MSRKLAPATDDTARALKAALTHVRLARTMLRLAEWELYTNAQSPRAGLKTSTAVKAARRALKSIEGAQRHASRRINA